MTERSRGRRADVALALVALGFGLAVAAAYAAWRAVSREDASSSARWSEFARDALLLPGLLIIVAVAAMVWFGWKANID